MLRTGEVSTTLSDEKFQPPILALNSILFNILISFDTQSLIAAELVVVQTNEFCLCFNKFLIKFWNKIISQNHIKCKYKFHECLKYWKSHT